MFPPPSLFGCFRGFGFAGSLDFVSIGSVRMLVEMKTVKCIDGLYVEELDDITRWWKYCQNDL